MACLAVWSWLAAANAVGFALAAWDKRQAGHAGRRVPERTLLAVALLGGWAGLLAAFAGFRHKVSKGRFLARFLVAVALDALLLLALLDRLRCLSLR